MNNFINHGKVIHKNENKINNIYNSSSLVFFCEISNQEN